MSHQDLQVDLVDQEGFVLLNEDFDKAEEGVLVVEEELLLRRVGLLAL
jgi:hypothetical protein